jgi:hypothetical protein
MNESNTRSEDVELSARLPGTHTVSLLYFAELEGLKVDHSTFVRESRSRGDTWLVTIRQEVYGPMRLRDAFNMLLQGEPEIALLHESETGNDTPTWRKIAYRAWWSRPNIALAWTASIGIVAALFGWIFVSLITPLWLSGPVEVLYWIVAIVAVFLLCIPAELRVRIKDRVLKTPVRQLPVDGAASQSLS